MSAATKSKDGFQRQPRYCSDGLTADHIALAQHVAVNGTDQDWSHLLDSITHISNHSLAYPLKNRGYLRSKKRNWIDQFAKGKLTLPTLDIDNLHLKFNEDDIITKFYNLSEDMPSSSSNTSRRGANMEPTAARQTRSSANAAASSTSGNCDASYTNATAGANNAAASTTDVAVYDDSFIRDICQLLVTIGGENENGLLAIIRDWFPNDGDNFHSSIQTRCLVIAKKVKDKADGEHYGLHLHNVKQKDGVFCSDKLKLVSPNVARSDIKRAGRLVAALAKAEKIQNPITDADIRRNEIVDKNLARTLEMMRNQFYKAYGPSFSKENGAPITSKKLYATPTDDKNNDTRFLVHTGYFNGGPTDRPTNPAEFRKKVVDLDVDVYVIWFLPILEQGILPPITPSKKDAPITANVAEVDELLNKLNFEG